MYQQRGKTCSSLKWCGMNFVGNDTFMLGTSAVSLPCNNNNALKSSLNYRVLRINHIGTWCSMTSSWAFWVLVINSWALLGFVFSIVLAGGYFLREVKPKFIPCYKCKSTVTEGAMQLIFLGCLLLPGQQYFRNAKQNVSWKQYLLKK